MRYIYQNALCLAILGLVLILATSFLLSEKTYAQFLPQQFAASELVFSPPFPEPSSSVHVSLQVFGADLESATIRWFVDGIEHKNAYNKKEATISVGTVGIPVTVDVLVTESSGGTIPIRGTVTPSYVDLVVEADTLAPSFYKGKSLPSRGSDATVVAIPHLGNSVDASELSYQWRENGSILYGGPVRGGQRAPITLQPFKDTKMTVEIIDGNNGIIAGQSVTITPRAPEILFYEHNPLRGMSRNSIRREVVFSGEEVIVRAEPYYTSSAATQSDPDYLYQWELDGKKVDNPSNDPLQMTLRGQPGSRARLGFSIRNLKEILQFAEGTFTLNFDTR